MWFLSVTGEHNPEVADLFNIRRRAEIAGNRIGVGDYRRRRGGRFEAQASEQATG